MARLEAEADEHGPDEPEPEPIKANGVWVFPRESALAIAQCWLLDHPPIGYHPESGWWRWANGCWSQVFSEEVERDVMLWLPNQRLGVRDKMGFSHTRALSAEPEEFDRVVKTIRRLRLITEHKAQGWLVTTDKPGFLLCLGDCLFDPETGRQYEHTPEYWTTSALKFSAREALEAPKPELWLRFLYESWGDKEVGMMQEWFGYCLTPDTSQQKFMFLVGQPGSGKGTILNILLALVGRKNALSVPMSFFGGDYKPADFAEKLLICVPDARDVRYGDALTEVLSITGGDDILVNPKMKSAFSAKPRGKIIIGSNDLPNLQDTSDALARRAIPLRRDQGPNHNEDPALAVKLLAELPGIFRWALEGLNRLRARGYFDISVLDPELRRELREAANPIAAFLEETVILDPHSTVRKTALFEAWLKWAKENSVRIIYNSNKFSRGVKGTLRITSERRGAGGLKQVYCGIRWRDSEREMEELGHG